MNKRILIFLGVFIILTNILYAITIDQAIYQLGKNFYAQARYNDALIQFDTLLNKHPFSLYYTDSLYYAAKSHFHLANYYEALNYFNRLEKKANSENDLRKAILGKAESYYRMGDYQQAVIYFTIYTRKYTESALMDAVLFYLAQSYEKLGMAQNALDHYVIIIRNFPNSNYYKAALKKTIVLSSGINYQTAEGNEYSIIQGNKNYTEHSDSQMSLSSNALDNVGALSNEPAYQIISVQTNTSSIKNGDFENNEAFAHTTLEITNTITNFLKLPITNLVTNMVIITQAVEVTASDTNQLEIQKVKEINLKTQKEIERLLQLLDMKAKLLEMKNKALKEKIDILQSTNK